MTELMGMLTNVRTVGSFNGKLRLLTIIIWLNELIESMEYPEQVLRKYVLVKCIT